eukprot:Gregarina_sp_Poly_1__3074@NODE_1866_length_3164_cov_320_885373_g342_i1_p1_GENE_NODE_1866_length_3164_cov_320_885373_g342_i1NODE_1866_length_3164_cov_320_885373_g342_i1_p1_ORF_typecomplete_len301_score48_77DnaB_C/PF03796_15/0_18PSK_trans_fac/PF07704_11/1_7e04PSK_trans_fac/PF07704_11/63PSK_trans_fac/PF07704_11/8_8_NODE_1866_length_3164_cov_320_885373_g342_i113092211
MATISRKSRQAAPSTAFEELQQPTWGDEKRWRARADVMLEEFLDILRPKYGSLIPTFAQSQAQPAPDSLVGPADREIADVLISKISNQLGVTDKSAIIDMDDEQLDEEQKETQPDENKLSQTHRSISRLEKMLNVPVWAQEDSLYPETAFDLGVAEAVGEAAEMAGTRRSQHRHETSAQEIERLSVFRPTVKRRAHSGTPTRAEQQLDDFSFRVGPTVHPIASKLMDRLNIVAPITYGSRSDSHKRHFTRDLESKIEGPRVGSIGELGAHQGWIEQIERIAQNPDIVADAGELKGTWLWI